jgi:hypothetical protein
MCVEHAISLNSYTVPLVQWSTRLLPVMRDPGSILKGDICETGILLIVSSRYIGDPDVIEPYLTLDMVSQSQQNFTFPWNIIVFALI